MSVLPQLIREWSKISSNCWNYGDVTSRSRETFYFRFIVSHFEIRGQVTSGNIGSVIASSGMVENVWVDF